MKIFLLCLLLPLGVCCQPFSAAEISAWKRQAAKVSIYRDSFGVPHIYGKNDADAVFGLLYAQCEDDFARVEMNYIEKLGRLSEIKGAASLYDDLLIRMLIDQTEAKRDYDKAPQWLKKLCNAFADAINFYLHSHPAVRPALLTRFEPWFPLLWTDGSIGAINTASLGSASLKRFYSEDRDLVTGGGEFAEPTVTGSNGFAISPAISANGKAMLYINPHVTFYFRPEVHMVSEEGLNSYGAVTWGQFFIYQGFNEHCGWMHTSSSVDAADVYKEKISKSGADFFYEYDGQKKPVSTKRITINYQADNGMTSRTFTTYATHHGPVLGGSGHSWQTLRADNRLANGLIQCWKRTKASGLKSFRKTLDLKGNISNNTVYADSKGNIAYWHGNRVPRKDTSYDWSKAVDGTTRATEWKGYHKVEETVHIINPANGWLQNCNSTPFTAAGMNSPQRKNYPTYMAPDGENFRGVNAVRVLSEGTGYTIDKLIAAGYDRRLTAFEVLVPALTKAIKTTQLHDSLFELHRAAAMLANWDFRSGENSVETTLAVEWGQLLQGGIYSTRLPEGVIADQVSLTTRFANTATASQLIEPFRMALRDIIAKYGSWQIPWGQINRLQRISPAIDNVFSDDQPGLAIGFASATWGQLPSYVSKSFPGTKYKYGYNGNSFVCAVEFGDKIRAKSLLAGGNSGNPTSPHYFDQADMYRKGIFKTVLFYKEDVVANAKQPYHPGSEH
ncbi:MAG: acylase [Chitinophagaceae bacterium]|nr:MAG: acylase [Chitinophagaceae bacterium]